MFFGFGCCAAGLTVILLLFPGTELDTLWMLNPGAREGFSSMGSWAVLMMAAVSAACLTAAVGLWRLAVWGLWTAAAILAINLVGDTANALIARDYRALIGLPVGGGMLTYLLTRKALFR